MTTITIKKTEYERLKKLEKVDTELLVKIIKGLEDVKYGRVKKLD